MKRAMVFIIFITLAFSGPAFAIDNPDFSGKWTLDMGKSDMGKARLPGSLEASKLTIVIKQTQSVLATTRNVGRGPETTILKLDGSESINKSPSGLDIRSTSRWEGPTLVTKSVMPTEHGTTESTLVRSLSADGKVMTIDTTTKTSAGSGELKQKLIYNKQ